MAALLYVSTSEQGIERTPDREVLWELPKASDTPQPAAPTHGERLVLRNAASLLDVIDDLVFVAEPLEAGVEEAHSVLVVRSARLLRRTPWDPTSAALFALDCAAHVLGESGGVELPGGITLAGALDDARSYLSEDDEQAGGRLGRLARFSAARRLRRAGETIGDVAHGLFEEDVQRDLDANLDATWATTAAAGDAVLAAVEALRHVAAPRYVAAREETAERDETGSPVLAAGPWQTPWGPVMLGVEHDSPYLPAGALAREAAFRAREAVGVEAAESERRFQAERLSEVLELS
jgi:hypothetical protein